MGLLDRKKLLEKEKLEVVRVDLGDGDFVYVRQMNGEERDRFEQSLIRETKDNTGNIGYERSLENFRGKLAVFTICDEKGELLLKPEDVTQLSQSMSARRLEKIVNVAQPLSQISEEDKDALTKKLDAGMTGVSSSDSV